MVDLFSPVRQLLTRLSSEIVQDVPDDISRCQFDCPANVCERGDWRTCQARLQAEESSSIWREDHATR